MKSETSDPVLDPALRLKNRQVANLETAISEFEREASLLDRHIRAEENRTGITDRLDPAYSSFAKSALQRSDNLRASVATLKAELEIALHERNSLMEQFGSSKKLTPH